MRLTLEVESARNGDSVNYAAHDSLNDVWYRGQVHAPDGVGADDAILADIMKLMRDKDK